MYNYVRVLVAVVYIPTAFHALPTHLLQFQPPRLENQITDLCYEIEKAINQNIQNALNSLEKDADSIVTYIDVKVRLDRYCVVYIMYVSCKNWAM